MTLRELTTALGIKNYPEALEAVYNRLDPSDERICDTSFIGALEERYGLLGEYYDTVLAGARELKSRRELLTWGKLAYAYSKDASRHEASLMPMPSSDGSAAADALPILALLREVPLAAKRYADRGFHEEQIAKNLENIKINIWVNKITKGSVSLNQGLYSWLAYYMKAMIFDHKGFNYQPTGWPPHSMLLKNKASGEYAILMARGRFTKDGLVLGSAGAVDEDGAFDAEFAETAQTFFGHRAKNGHVQSTFEAFEKTEWEAVLRHGDGVLNLHIPRNTNLDPSYVSESLKEGLALARKHYPELSLKCIVCTSWLMDPVLADILGPDAKLSAFGRRFMRHPVMDVTGTGCLGFVWPGEACPAAALSEKTTLQRGIKGLMLAGDYIRTTAGILADDL